MPTGDINCRDCDVRSLAEPEPNRQVFVKFKHLLRKAAPRSAETICVIIGEILRAFTPTECANYFRNSRYAQSQKHHALVFVRLAHDRRLVAAVLFVLFLFVLVLFVFIRISGRLVLPMITKGLLSINLVKNSSGMCGVMLLLLGCGGTWLRSAGRSRRHTRWVEWRPQSPLRWGRFFCQNGGGVAGGLTGRLVV